MALGEAQNLGDLLAGLRQDADQGFLAVGGQSVAVKERAVLAVEAIEGTDRAILRAGELCPAGGFTVVKVAKPQQDMRFDVPTVGCATVESLRRAGGRVLAASDQAGLLTERVSCRMDGQTSGVARDPRTGTVTAFHRTPGYETYRGLGWYGMIVQTDPSVGRSGAGPA